MDTTKVSMIIMSHLAAAQSLIGLQGQESLLHQHIGFAKWLTFRFRNTMKEIDANAEWELYIQKYPIKKIAMANCG